MTFNPFRPYTAAPTDQADKARLQIAPAYRRSRHAGGDSYVDLELTTPITQPTHSTLRWPQPKVAATEQGLEQVLDLLEEAIEGRIKLRIKKS